MVTAYLLALASAALYGAADFMGGIATRRAPVVTVVLVSQAAGLALLLVLTLLIQGSAPVPGDFLWGGVAGLNGSIGVALLYRALAIGRMSVVAPTTAVCAVAIPVLADFAVGHRPGTLTGAGMALALAAIVLVSRTKESDVPHGHGQFRSRSRGVGMALVSGVAIGLFFLALARTSPQAGLWPLAAARSVSVALFTLIAVLSRGSLAMSPGISRVVVVAGALDMLANALYLVATRDGPLGVIVTLASLYPASTVLLARLVLSERLSRLQLAGVACALVSIALIVGTR